MEQSRERFWAKTGKGQLGPNGEPLYHPVICHLADTAAVAMEMVRTYLSPVAVVTLAKGLGLSGEDLIRCCGFLAGSHDLGKVSPVFQYQVSNIGQMLSGSKLYEGWFKYAQGLEKTGHGLITAKTLPEFLVEHGINNRLARRLAEIVGGHHGYFPSAQEIKGLPKVQMGEAKWPCFRRVIFEQLNTFVGWTVAPTKCDNAAAMLLAGLTTVADWVASNEQSFPYTPDQPFEEYAQGLKDKAETALKKLGWSQAKTGEPLPFTELFAGFTPRPLQEAAIALTAGLTSPCLVLVEASMGEGKTEAALYLADYLQHQTGTGGFYIGLPTQATSNAMWKRTKAFLGKRYPEDVINLTLSHGAAVLKTEYIKSSCRLDQVFDQEGRVVASEWHTARKRTLLSPYGVGTLDQGLMGVVRSRHQFVRLFGLAGRTVILDEIHAYDLYTSTLLERFVEWLALLGSPVLALSATLPRSTRAQLVQAYARGAGFRQTSLPEVTYPRLTALTAQGVQVKPFEASEHVRRTLHLHWVADDHWAEELRGTLQEGGCAAVICSTVDRAQQVYARLQGYFEPAELKLFHARFLFKDREAIEADCLDKFGKEGSNRPLRYVLVATQVIEQSLDVDFDVMVSDLAPIDLLLQRSGREHRHHIEEMGKDEHKIERPRQRPPRLKEPALWLVKPKISAEGMVNFLESGYIYDRHILLRTWLTLRHRVSVVLPKEMDMLIESVYDLEAVIPAEVEPSHATDWQESLSAYCLDCEVMTSNASDARIPPTLEETKVDNFTRRATEDDEGAIMHMTRMGEPSVTTIFLQQTPQGLVLPRTGLAVDLEKTPQLEEIQALLSHSTRLGKKGLVNALLAQARPSIWKSALLRNCRHVVLDESREALVSDWRLILDEQMGVVIEKLQQSKDQ
ncbi:CRISPR-associated helicase Cas3' [Anthocerotibacter panamensis]|uniref:CRISPR-associated helicase Cas3' n=1 Tax=Anthocerotibacter panamensis TaxID=2857077 RepID=UPI001C405E7B|nr:CRISPR-associated helicase Cas3' [Anthocerotibacter panamensis]